MDATDKQKRTFIGYEYREVVADRKEADFLMDSYENFGWEVLGEYGMGRTKVNSPYQYKIAFRMRRNRKIMNKMELTRLQRHFEACVSEIKELERGKTSLAAAYALIVGIIGTAFMAASVFAVVASPPHIILCIFFAIPGFIGWIFPYFIYKKVEAGQTKKMNLLIEKKYDEIYEICEKGNKLLNMVNTPKKVAFMGNDTL